MVDDTPDALELCSEYLRLHDFRVETATDGLLGIQKALEVQPDLILMDLSMPNMDGWEATRHLKSDNRTREIPVIAVTALAENARASALAAGCSGFLTKPVYPRNLVNEVRRHLDRTGEGPPDRAS
ncbi:MAG TPA: response regulator [Thermoanaerobaculia bacterium]|nr:response regulator [Thermoanaerobaculia bacterium]